VLGKTAGELSAATIEFAKEPLAYFSAPARIISVFDGFFTVPDFSATQRQTQPVSKSIRPYNMAQPAFNHIAFQYIGGGVLAS
jgi:hypothetical protein